ncbi:MAG: alpha/beta hydrolase [Anaerolineae bacterium]|nr:alpha/beta hydrolase [Anaerolineae bacterium]
MSAISIGSDLVHYEVLGRGKPVVLLHSWLGSWRYWIPTMQQLSVKYRTYALDLWGFGDSGKNYPQYGLEGQTELLRDFVNKMGIPKAVFIGHGLGAAVITHFANDPECRSIVHRLMAIAPPLFDMAPRPLTANTAQQKSPLPAIAPVSSNEAVVAGMSTSGAADAPTLIRPTSDIDREKLRQAALAAGLDGLASRIKTNTTANPTPTTTPANPAPPETPSVPAPVAPTPPAAAVEETRLSGQPTPAKGTQALLNNPIAGLMGDMNPLNMLKTHVDNSSSDFEKLKAEVAKVKSDVIAASTDSFKHINTFRELLQVAAPTVVLLGEADTFMKLPEETVLSQLSARQQFNLTVMEGIRHFPMLEDPAKFTRFLRDFLETPDVTDLAMKEEWRRRTR